MLPEMGRELCLFSQVLYLTSSPRFKSHLSILHTVIKTFTFWNQFPFFFAQPLIHFSPHFCSIAAKSCTAPCVNLCRFQNALIHIFANWQVIGKHANELLQLFPSSLKHQFGISTPFPNSWQWGELNAITPNLAGLAEIACSYGWLSIRWMVKTSTGCKCTEITSRCAEKASEE